MVSWEEMQRHTRYLGSLELNILVIVDVEFGIWIGLAGCAECNTDKVLTEHSAEHRLTGWTEGTALGKDLIEDILMMCQTLLSTTTTPCHGKICRTYPLKDLALVSGHDGRNVILDDSGQVALARDGTDP